MTDIDDIDDDGRQGHYWDCEGEVRGRCGHRHRTENAARACLERDRAGCRKHGGYSDRRVVFHLAGGAT